MLDKLLLASVAALALGGCGLWGDDPPELAVTQAALETQTVNPGDALKVSYAVGYSESWNDVIAVEIAGLPENTRAAGTQQSLPVPSGSNAARTATVTLRPPARAGEYPLTLRARTKDGMTAVGRLGTLTIADIPGSIPFAQFEPSSHSTSRCATPTISATLKYVVEDPNGAADVVDLRLTRATADPPVAGSPVPLAGQSRQAMEITPPSAGGSDAPLLSAAGQGAGGGRLVEVPLPKAAGDVTTRETLSTPVRINCAVPTPVVWKWQIVGVDRDGATGALRPTNAARLDYFSTQ